MKAAISVSFVLFCLLLPSEGASNDDKNASPSTKKSASMIKFSISILKVLAKFGLCSNCSQKLDECSLIHARKIFATARMLKFLFKFPAVWSKHNLRLGNKTDTGNNVSRMGK